MEINITEISQEEAQNISFRTSHKWNMEEMEDFVKGMVEDYKGKIVRIPVSEFYKQFYSGESEIKHMNYYCKKKLQAVLDNLKINCKVSSTQKWNGVIIVQLASIQDGNVEEETTGEDE